MFNEAGLRVAWLTIPRSGSEFLVALTRSLLGQAVEPTSSLTPGRAEKLLTTNTFDSYLDQQRAVDYFRDNMVRSVKIEAPFADQILTHIAKAFPACRYLASIRSFDKMAMSHLRISWGWQPKKLLNVYRAHTQRVIDFAQQSRVLFIDTEWKELFDSRLFAQFLGAERNARFDAFVKSWPVVNPLAYRVERDGGHSPAEDDLDDEIRSEGQALDSTLRNFAEINNDSFARQFAEAKNIFYEPAG
jgi:hypothetical protein